jgi:hypothetical protein
MRSEQGIFVRQKQEPAGDNAGAQDDEQGGKYSPDATGIKGGEPKSVPLQTTENNRCDQIARDHEEDVDTDKATSKNRRKRVKNDDRQNGNRAQSVDVRTIVICLRHLWRNGRLPNN